MRLETTWLFDALDVAGPFSPHLLCTEEHLRPIRARVARVDANTGLNRSPKKNA
jgi:hypothetical protein